MGSSMLIKCLKKFEGVFFAPQKRGRPMKGWLRDVEDDIKKMQNRNRREASKDRNKWRQTVVEVKAHCGL